MMPLLLAAETPPVDGGPAAAIAIAVVFMIVAIGLFFLEILVPSFGLIVLLGVGCVVGGLMAAFSVNATAGVVFIAAAVVAIPFSVYLAIKLAGRTGLILGSKDDPHTGKAGATEARSGERVEVGARGVAMSTLRPSGTASFDGPKISVVTEGEMVESGEQIEVIRVETMRTVVRPVRV